MDISALYGRTWKLFRNNPRLWLIALLGTLVGGSELGGGGGGSLNLPSNLSDTGSDPFGDFGNTFNPDNLLPILIGVLICGIVLIVVFTILGMITRGGLLIMTDALHADEQPTVGACLRGGLRRAGALFLSLLVLGLPILLLSLLLVGIGIAFFAAGAGASSEFSEGNLLGIVLGGLACLLPLVLLMVFLGMVISVLGFFVGRLTVLDGMGPLAAVRTAWQIFRANIGATLLTWIALGLPGAVTGVALLIPSLILVVPAVLFVVSSQASAASIGVAVVAVLALLALSVAVSTFVGAFVSQGWTVFYRGLRDRVAGEVAVGV